MTLGRITTTTPPTGGRRRLVGALLATVAGAGLTSGIAAGVATAAADLASPEPDAELLSLCERFDEIERRHFIEVTACGRAEDDDGCDAAMERMADEHEPLLERIMELPPLTYAGAVALARTLQQWSHGDYADGDCTDDRLAKTLLQGLAPLDARAHPRRDLQREAPHAELDANLLWRQADLFAAAEAVGHAEVREASDEHLDQACDRLRELCWATVEQPAAQTAAGRALKAAAAMHELKSGYRYGAWHSNGQALAWHVLSEIAGDTYVPIRHVSAQAADLEPRRA